MTLPGQRVRFDDLKGFGTGDHAGALEVFRTSAKAVVESRPPQRPAVPVFAGLRSICQSAIDLGPAVTDQAARRFFTDNFVPHHLGDDAFFTGYYEPIVEGSLGETATFTAPLLARPPDLKTFASDEPRPDWARDLAAARVGPDGTLCPYPTRAAIEARVGSDGFRPLVWLRDWTEVFLIQVQGSARVRLPDGHMLRMTYAGRNGHPYTSIGRLLVENGAIPLETMSLERLKAWLRGSGQAPGEAGRTLMQRNASYIFFAIEPEADDVGPTGGAGVPLTARRSIAVDRALWCYGLPFWIDAALPTQSGAATPFRHLTIAQDTGSAIVGAARVDLFLGSGADAGARAGDLRHHGKLVVLLPRTDGGAA